MNPRTGRHSDKGTQTRLLGYVPPCIGVELYDGSHTCTRPPIHTSTLVPLHKGVRGDGCNNLYILISISVIICSNDCGQVFRLG